MGGRELSAGLLGDWDEGRGMGVGISASGIGGLLVGDVICPYQVVRCVVGLALGNGLGVGGEELLVVWLGIDEVMIVMGGLRLSNWRWGFLLR